MCGRFFRLQPREELARAFNARMTVAEAPARFNIAPGQNVLAVRYNARNHERTLDELSWGLIPHFAQDRKIAWKCINARSETLQTTGSFRSAFEKRRCIIIADGFFEWKAQGKSKKPYAIALTTREPFGMAGLWENWKDPATGEWVRSCTVITTAANPLVAEIHDRMPAILDPTQHARWLGEESATPEQLRAALQPFDAARMMMWPVSARLNSARNEDANMLEVVAEEQPELRFDEP